MLFAFSQEHFSLKPFPFGKSKKEEDKRQKEDDEEEEKKKKEDEDEEEEQEAGEQFSEKLIRITKNIDNEQEYFILNDLSDSLFVTKIVSLLKP